MDFLLLAFSLSYCIHFSIDQFSTSSILSAAHLQYSSDISQPRHFRFNCSATTADVPDPMKGSITKSPMFDDANISFLNNSSGFCVGCGVFSCIPLHVVGISITSLGLAPFGLGCQISLLFPFFLPYWLVSA